MHQWCQSTNFTAPGCMYMILPGFVQSMNLAAFLLTRLLLGVIIIEPTHAKTDQVAVRPVSRNRCLKTFGCHYRRVRWQTSKAHNFTWINIFSNVFVFCFVFFGKFQIQKIKKCDFGKTMPLGGFSPEPAQLFIIKMFQFLFNPLSFRHCLPIFRSWPHHWPSQLSAYSSA